MVKKINKADYVIFNVKASFNIKNFFENENGMTSKCELDLGFPETLYQKRVEGAKGDKILVHYAGRIHKANIVTTVSQVKKIKISGVKILEHYLSKY